MHIKLTNAETTRVDNPTGRRTDREADIVVGGQEPLSLSGQLKRNCKGMRRLQPINKMFLAQFDQLQYAVAMRQSTKSSVERRAGAGTSIVPSTVVS